MKFIYFILSCCERSFSIVDYDNVQDMTRRLKIKTLKKV